MGFEQIRKNGEKQNNQNSSNGGIVSQRLMNTPLMQQRAKEHQVMFGKTIQKQEDKIENSNSIIQTYPYINSDPPARKDAQIYGIYEMNNGTLGKCVYVGQTTLDRAGSRFIEHVKNDSWAPWYGKDYSSNNANDWPYVPREFQELRDVTKFEVTVAEQWWIDNEGGVSNLKNNVNAMTTATFDKYKTIVDNYDASNIYIPKSWKP